MRRGRRGDDPRMAAPADDHPNGSRSSGNRRPKRAAAARRLGAADRVGVRSRPGSCPAVSLEQSGRGRRRRALPRAPERDRAAAASRRCGCRSWSPSASCSCSSSTPALLLLIAEAIPDWLSIAGFGDALLAALLIAAVGTVLQVDRRDQRRRRVQRARDPARRAPARRRGRAPTSPASSTWRSTAWRCPCSSRAMRDGNAPDDGALDRRRRLPPRRVGDRSVLADRREPGRDPARLQRGHPGVPVGREGDRDDDGLLERRRLRRDRAPSRHRHRAAGRRRREPREPAVRRGGRGDPDRQPARRREAREPGLPRLPGQRLQRHAAAGAVPVGGRPWR